MIVVLMGYMGCGKSTVGKDLATVLNYDFLDLDDYISRKENSTIQHIFKTKGEIYFRKQESQYLVELINSSKSLVLALGGGTPCYGNNLDLLLNNASVKLFYLKLSLPLLADRLFMECASRPLISHLNSKDDLLEFIGKHLFERVQYYNKAEFSITTDYKTIKDILEEILTHLI